MKGLLPDIGHYLKIMFNLILKRGTICDERRTSKLRILYKGKGEQSDPNSYRRITFISHVCKLLTFIANRLVEYMDKNKTIPNEQYGFRAGRSATSAIKILRDYIVNNFSSFKGGVYVAFIDFAKAFDRIDRHLLLRKLTIIHSITGRILNLIADLLRPNWVCICDGE
ncbi:hypothetical protein GJ496_011941 [Pomphorhynchus laevis]|nr:hypothetical protein GJ496_011941 [Pomphorhynchus laevis]